MNKQEEVSRLQLPETTDFGIFYPVDYLVVAFPSQDDAQQVRRDLLAGGYDAADCEQFTSNEVAVAAQGNLDENTGFFARLGWSSEAVRVHLDAALSGAAFLMIFAPGDTDVERAMTVIRRVPFAFAHRYCSLAIEEMH